MSYEYDHRPPFALRLIDISDSRVAFTIKKKIDFEFSLNNVQLIL